MRRLTVLLLLACGGTQRASLPDAVTPRCTSSDASVVCSHQTTTLSAGGLERPVLWQLPTGSAPDAGWPAAVLFQGSFFSATRSWSAVPSDPFGGFHQAQVVQTLLEHGFAVITPEAKVDGSTYWDTNIVPWSLAWETSADHALMVTLFSELDAGTFGPIDLKELFAAGISSGGYMTSRMALSYPGHFRALAIESASWATCGGPVCVLPSKLPTDHPPTLFLHGEQDSIVPIATARSYEAQLKAEGHETRFVSDADAGHEWLSVAPDEVRTFFVAHE
jgi:poly(3-hydroxybutyrate) depolymerase